MTRSRLSVVAMCFTQIVWSNGVRCHCLGKWNNGNKWNLSRKEFVSVSETLIHGFLIHICSVMELVHLLLFSSERKCSGQEHWWCDDVRFFQPREHLVVFFFFGGGRFYGVYRGLLFWHHDSQLLEYAHNFSHRQGNDGCQSCGKPWRPVAETAPVPSS